MHAWIGLHKQVGSELSASLNTLKERKAAEGGGVDQLVRECCGIQKEAGHTARRG